MSIDAQSPSGALGSTRHESKPGQGKFSKVPLTTGDSKSPFATREVCAAA